jgi:hypothetical protein
VPLLLGQTRTSSISEVCIKDIEDIVGKFCRLSEGKELLIYPTKFGLVEITGETAFLKALVSDFEYFFDASVLT